MYRYMRENLIARKRKYVIRKRIKLFAVTIVILTSAGFLIANKSKMPATDAIFRDYQESYVTLTVSDEVYNDVIDGIDINKQNQSVIDEVYLNAPPIIEQDFTENNDTDGLNPAVPEENVTEPYNSDMH